MPFCKVSSDVCLHYVTNSPENDVLRFDASKPTVLLLHPVALDVTWLRRQFQDPRLDKAYNLIAFDQRNLGKTKSPYSARRDSYVDAADIGFAHELLQLPPVHVLAANMNSAYAAARFAILFPSKCLSLCFCGVPVDPPLEWVPKAFTDLLEIWCFPPDLETFEQAAMEMSHFLFGGQIPTQLEDEIVEWWETNLPPRKRRTVMELTFARCPATREEFGRITQPTLLMAGDKCLVHPIEEAVKVHQMISGSQFFVVKGAPEMFLILPQYASIANRVITDFLSRLGPAPIFVPSKPDLVNVSKEALARLAEIRGDDAVASRDPLDPMSFSMWPPDVVARHQAYLDQMALGEEEALSPLDDNGHPIRKFSSRHDGQWTRAAFDQISDTLKQMRGIEIQTSS